MGETPDDKFRSDCVEQIKRLGVFDSFRCMDTTARKEYRKFFESKTRDIAKVEQVIDEAVRLESMPTIAELYALWSGLFSPMNNSIQSPDGRPGPPQWVSDWYALSFAEAEIRKREFIAKRNFNRHLAPSVTDAEIEAIRTRQEQNQRRIADGIESLNR